MRRQIRLSVICVAVAFLTLSTASEAATKPFVAKLKNTVCTHSGSTHGFGTLDTTGQMTENGKNGTNYMRITGTMQERSGDKWVKVFTYAPYTSATFANNAASHTFGQTFLWAFRDFEVGHTMRWKLKFEWFDQRPGPDRKLATKTKYSAACTA
jgi:hypothetical protein